VPPVEPPAAPYGRPDAPGGSPPPRPGRANLVLAGLIALAGVAAFVAAVGSGRGDSAALFVGLPVLLAIALALTPGRTGHGRVFRVTTIVLLLAAVFLHEGAICVLLAAPIVYAVAHGVTALIHWQRRAPRAYAVLPVPLLLLAAVEGTTPDLRIRPDEAVTVTRVVALTPAEVADRVTAGPHPAPVRSAALRALGVPMPEHVVGGGTEVGDRWCFGYHASSHGPGGSLVTRVTGRGPDRVDFTVEQNTTITGRWFAFRAAWVRWRPVDATHTEVSVQISYRRRLDPSWYFGPVEHGLLHEGSGQLLDMMDLR
jgi:hypothetical protein